MQYNVTVQCSDKQNLGHARMKKDLKILRNAADPENQPDDGDKQSKTFAVAVATPFLLFHRLLFTFISTPLAHPFTATMKFSYCYALVSGLMATGLASPGSFRSLVPIIV